MTQMKGMVCYIRAKCNFFLRHLTRLLVCCVSTWQARIVLRKKMADSTEIV